MASVTHRINMIKQPYGGYLPVRYFHKTQYADEYSLYEEENIHSSLVGLAVDYLSRYMLGAAAEDAFNISLRGASIIDEIDEAYDLLQRITGLNTESITCACKLSGYDVCFRSGTQGYKPVEDIEPDEATIHNIRVMVIRCMNLFEIIGPITKTCIEFDGGYTPVVDKGDGDYMTEDAIWDLKVSKSTPTSKHTLQLLMYYVMGLHSIYPEFNHIKHLGIFNPRLNLAYTQDIDNIPPEIIQCIESDVICYGMDNIPEIDIRKEKAITYTVAEASKYLGVKKTWLFKQIRENTIPATKVKNRYEIDIDTILALEEHIRKQKTINSVITMLVAVFMIVLFLIMFNSNIYDFL